jgi:uncharacterized membrane protein
VLGLLGFSLGFCGRASLGFPLLGFLGLSLGFGGICLLLCLLGVAAVVLMIIKTWVTVGSRRDE